MNHPPDSSKPRPSKIYNIIVAEARNWNDEKREFFEGISRTIVIGRDETRTVGTLEISTDSRLSQQREDRLTFIRCRVAPRNMRNSVETRALCLQNREKRRRFSDKHTDPSIRPYASKRMTRPVNLTSKPVYIPFTIADLATRDRLFVHRQRYMRGISFYYRIRGKECLDRSRTIWNGIDICIKIINFLKRYSC